MSYEYDWGEEFNWIQQWDLLLRSLEPKECKIAVSLFYSFYSQTVESSFSGCSSEKVFAPL